MTKRQLDKQEKEYTEKGILRIEKENEVLKQQKNFNDLTINFQKAQETYQDAVRPYLKKKKEEEDKKVMMMVDEQILRNNNSLNNLKDQIKNGVIIKSIKETK